MKILRWLFLPLYMLVCFVAVGIPAIAPDTAAQDQLIFNGDFEANADQYPQWADGWYAFNPNGDSWVCDCESCEFLFIGNATPTSPRKRLVQLIKYTGQAGTVLHLKVDSRAREWSGAANVQLTLYFTDGTKAATRFKLSTGVNGFTMEGFTTALKDFDKVKVSLRANGYTGRFWLDNVSLTTE